jgi:restriction endonuclease S subunit
MYFLRSSSYWHQIAFSQIQATIQNVSAERYKELILALPPVDEQVRALEQVDAECNRIDAISQRTKRSIELRPEHRSALITAAVTGQIDVRDAA